MEDELPPLDGEPSSLSNEMLPEGNVFDRTKPPTLFFAAPPRAGVRWPRRVGRPTLAGQGALPRVRVLVCVPGGLAFSLADLGCAGLRCRACAPRAVSPDYSPWPKLELPAPQKLLAVERPQLFAVDDRRGAIG